MKIKISVLVGLGSLAFITEAKAVDISGSDTLANLTRSLLATGNCGTNVYLGGGSTQGERDTCFGAFQDGTTMSRTLDRGRVCGNTAAGGTTRTPPGTPMPAAACIDEATDPRSRRIARDGIAILRSNPAPGNICVNLDNVNVGPCDDEGDCEGNPNFQCESNADCIFPRQLGTLPNPGTGTILDAIQIIYAGSAGTGNSADCGSALRQAVVNDYPALFGALSPEDCDGCAQISHAYRRGDASGTTDTFNTLVGITGYCNGLDFADADPIRRPCDDVTTDGDPVD